MSSALPAAVRVRAGDAQATRVGRAFAAQLTAVVLDVAERPVAGVRVSFRVLSGPASFAGGAAVAVATTTAKGVATAAVLAAAERTGPVAVSASTYGVGRPAAFGLRVLPA